MGERMSFTPFSIKINEGSTLEQVTSRWSTDSFKDLQERVRQAIKCSSELPEDIPGIEAESAGGSMELLDLRGIDLSRMEIGEVDLSYCCFDGANFFKSRLERTHLQFSSFMSANFDRSTWKFVQASPIFANNASFKSANIDSSFLMRSSFIKAFFRLAQIHNVAFVGASLQISDLESTNSLSNVDIAGIFDSRLGSKRTAYKEPGQRHAYFQDGNGGYDFSELSAFDLNILKEKIAKDLQQRRTREIADARQQIAKIAQSVGVSLGDLSSSKNKVKVNYKVKRPSWIDRERPSKNTKQVLAMVKKMNPSKP
jgi:uncharacterized protein YjbI with pentapeptide repeats